MQSSILFNKHYINFYSFDEFLYFYSNEVNCQVLIKTLYHPYLSLSLISTLRIFPLIVLGSSSTNSIILGYLYGAVTVFTCS